MLDRSDPGAKVVSLACDRYIAGLPAVEQYIDAKLDPLPLDESMLATADSSEGMGGDKRPRGEAFPRDARRGPPQRRDSHQRDGSSRDANRSRSQPRDANRSRDLPRDAYPRDSYPREGRSPDIRKSISEATGGALDMSGALPQDSGYPSLRPIDRLPTRPRATTRPGEASASRRQGGGTQGASPSRSSSFRK